MRKNTKTRALGPYEKDGRFFLVIKATDAKGSRRSNKFFDKRKDAQAFKDTVNEEARARDSKTLALAIDAFIKAQQTKGNKTSTTLRKRAHLNSFFGDDQERTVASVTSEYCRERYAQLSDEDSSTSVAVDTHRNTLQEVRRFFTWAQKESLIIDHPSLDIEPVGRRRRGKAQLRLNEARTLLTLADTILAILDSPNPIPGLDALEVRPPRWVGSNRQNMDEYGLLVRRGVTSVLTALFLGMRASEIVSRRVRDLDDEGRLLWVGDASLDDTKTEASRRLLRVPETLRGHLLRLAKDQGPEALLFGVSDRKVPLYWSKKLSVMIGLPPMTAHGFRGSFASLSSAQGIASSAVAAALGHASKGVTEAHYIRPEALNESSTRILEDTLDL